jgi:hypothetical protein
LRALRSSPALPYWIGVVTSLAFAFAIDVFTRRESLVHLTDFSGYWAGGRALLVGADPYDPTTWLATTAMLGTQPPDTAVYGYFPWVALAMVPLALLPLETAAWLWCIGSIVVAALGLAALLRVRPCPPAAALAIGFCLFGSQPALAALTVGQWSPMLTGGLAFALATLLRGRIAPAVAALLLTLAKPQLFLVTVPVLALRYRRLVVPLAVAGLAIVAVSTLLMPGWIGAWTANVPQERLTSRAAVPPSLFALLFGPAAAPLGWIVVAALAIVIFARFGTIGLPALAAWLTLSALAAPYAWSYDWLLLIVPFTIGISVLAPVRPIRARALTVAGTSLLMLAAPLLYGVAVTRGSETLSVLVPLAFAVALVIALWPLVRSTTGDRERTAPASPTRRTADA